MEYEMYQTTTSMSAAEAAALGGVFLVFGSIMLIIIIVMIVAMWKIFAKAGEPGWKALIPVITLGFSSNLATKLAGGLLSDLFHSSILLRSFLWQLPHTISASNLAKRVGG